MKRNFLIIIGVLALAILACTASEKATIEAAFATDEAINAEETKSAIIIESTMRAIDAATATADFVTADASRKETAEAEFYFATETPSPPTVSPITATISTPSPPIDVTPTCTGTQHTLPVTATVRFPVPPNASLQQADDGSISIDFPVDNQSTFDTWQSFIGENYLTNSTSSYSTDSSGKNFDWQIDLRFPPGTQMIPLADRQTEFLYSPVPWKDVPADDTTVTRLSIIEMPLPPNGTEPQYSDDGQVVINFSVNDKAAFDGWVQFMNSNFISGGTSYDTPFTEGTLEFNFPISTTIEVTNTVWIITVPR